MENLNERQIKADEMRLGFPEFVAMNNPLRRWVQKNVEFRIFRNQLKRHGFDLHGKVIMDAGCGSGYSTGLIIKEFQPVHIMAFDYMPEQINLARKRNLKVDFSIGDLTNIKSSDTVFDALFIFGVLHHIPKWRTALSEVSRVLKGDGIFLVDEPSFTRFTWKEFEAGIREAGFEILDVKKFFLAYFHAYLCRKRLTPGTHE